jgi:hypothetical protein
MKKILVIGFSQTGQLHDILTKIYSSLDNITVDFVKPTPKIAYPFPWDTFTFFSQMPKAVLGETVEMENMSFKEEKYDLIIFGYQVWFLSPSVPSNSIIQDPKFAEIAKDTDIITVIGARNMWMMSQERIKKRLAEIGANLIGNIALVDSATNILSVITISHWLMRGKKDRKWGIFPYPGVQKKDIENTVNFGVPINKYLHQSEINLQKEILKLGATKVKTTLVFTESRGILIFKKWAQLINKKGTTKKKLSRWLTVFRIYLKVAIYIVSPIVLLIFSIVRLLIFKKLRKEKQYYQGISLK